MSTPENTPAPEGQSDPDADDDAAQEALAALAAQEADGEEAEEDDDKFDAERARKKIEKTNREAKALRERIKQLEPLAAEAEQRRKGEMSEAQRLAEEKAELEVQLAELRTTNVRREAASAAGLPPEFVEFITGAEPEEALAQAKKLAKAMKASDSPRQPDFRQGARGTSNSGNSQTPDDLLRQMAGRRR